MLTYAGMCHRCDSTSARARGGGACKECGGQHTLAYVSKRQQTLEYVSIRQPLRRLGPRAVVLTKNAQAEEIIEWRMLSDVCCRMLTYADVF